MSLKGSLETVALPEVLHFLSSTGKSGDFHVSDGRAQGHMWFQEGRISGFQAGMADEVFEAIFELLRIPDGEFTFAAGVEAPADARQVSGDAGDLEPALAAAQDRLKEWHQIVSVVPSAAHMVRLSDAVPAKMVRLEPQQWVMVVAIGAGRSVGEVIDTMSLREFEGFRAVRTLVDSSLVLVDEPVASVVEEAPMAEEAVVEHDGAAWDSTAWDQVAEVEPVAGYEPAAEYEPVVDVPEYPAEAEEENAIAGDLLRFGVAPEAEAVEEHGYEAAHFSGEHSDDSEHASAESDRYAALRAAMVEVGEDLVPFEGATAEEEGHAVHYQAGSETDGRAALQALLSEVTDGEADGRADQGAWSDHEQWGSEEHEASNIVPFAPVHYAGSESDAAGEPADAEEAEDAQPTEEPMNRGLLLKFLSSVRN